MKKIVNGIEIKMTEEEIIELENSRIICLDQAKMNKKDLNASARYKHETNGIYYNEYFLLTEREDINILNSAMEKIRRGFVESIEWKCGNRLYLMLTGLNIDEIEILILMHIQGSFAKEKYYNDLICACTTIEELNNIELVY